MENILRDFSEPALVAAIRANLLECCRYLGRSPKADLYDSRNLTWLLTGIRHPWLNAVIHTQLKPDKVDEVIEETLSHFRSRNVAMLSWWIEPDTQPTDLGKHLIAHGLIYTEDQPGMAVDLLTLNEDLPTPSHLGIERVGDTRTLREWMHALNIGFGMSETSEKAWFDLFSGLGFHPPFCCYIGFVDGKAVATSALFLGAGVAGVYCVATIPEMRRQGTGTAMTLAPLRCARAMGYRIGIIHSSQMGLRIYHRLGFQEYCKVSYYLWVSGTERD